MSYPPTGLGHYRLYLRKHMKKFYIRQNLKTQFEFCKDLLDKRIYVQI